MSLVISLPPAPNELSGSSHFKMATIEPRLIHLLNESTTPQLSHTDLPSRHGLLPPASPDRPLAPIHSDGIHRSERSGFEGPAVAAGLGSLHLFGDDVPVIHKGDGRQDGKHAGGVAAYPLRLALADADASDLPSHFSKIRDDVSDSHDDCANKKRTRALAVKDDFVQLPQPVKKQKAAPQTHAFPPIINGLYEPPPHAALFPPIASNSLEEHDANQIKLLNDFNRSSDAKANRLSPSDTDKTASKDASKGRKRATKPRRKWSDAETKHLLLGVNKYGVGKWTSILEDPSFRFDERTAGDLKDRFRTCCPDELRRSSNKSPHPDSPPLSLVEPCQKTKKGIHSENILIEEEASPTHDAASASHNESDSGSKHKKSRAHRKNLADLAELGIHGPFKKSQRRERRPFTDQDDREILEGLDLYGPAWTKIQRDPRFNFSSRQPTDLRDRVRNKYPDIYLRIEKGTFQSKDGARNNDILEPSVTMSISNSLERSKTASMDSQTNRRGSREELLRRTLQPGDATDIGHSIHLSELAESTTPHFMGGEMDISRLLLDESRFLRTPNKKGMESASGSSSPSNFNH
ncbi:40S ribosomal protein S4-A [Paramyrothecium foliicola]|nr:40S ribosomal protein S4-A [Paramyrothecium foliicola]